MRLALAQYALTEDPEVNLSRVLDLLHEAADRGAQMLLFPELCLSPFFPQYAGRDASRYRLELGSSAITQLRAAAGDAGLYAVPNVYLAGDTGSFDASLLIAPDGEIQGISKMVHIAQAPGFFEQDYYSPSDDGFQVYDLPHGRVGIVVCFDRHFPESIRTCVLRGAALILIPTANTMAEQRTWFEWEMRVAARQNGVWIAMCNRVGQEGNTVFCGDSLVVDPEGEIVVKAGEGEELCVTDIDFEMALTAWQRQIYLGLRRPDHYSA